MSQNILDEYAAMDREAAADHHESKGGDRVAFLHGWDSWMRGQGLFSGMRFYPQGSPAQKGFVIGWQCADRAADTPAELD
jgi:hypothetical protein